MCGHWPLPSLSYPCTSSHPLFLVEYIMYQSGIILVQHFLSILAICTAHCHLRYSTLLAVSHFNAPNCLILSMFLFVYPCVFNVFRIHLGAKFDIH